MQRFLIITTNCLLLLFLLIGLPAATRAHWGDTQLSSAATGRLLLFWGLGIAAGANFFGGLVFSIGRKAKILCWEWTAVYAALWLAEYGFVRGYFNFEWLKEFLLWLQKHLPSEK